MKKIAVPEMMRAVEIYKNKLRLVMRPVPVPARGEVLIRVAAAGVNRPDLLQVQGKYPPPSGITDIPGLEISGIVITGSGKIKAGQKVCALVAGGGYAEYCTVPAPQCLPLPRGFGFIKAAALPETFFTVWRNLVDFGKLRKGEMVLIHGGTSGIGTTAIQVAKSLGVKVIVTAGTDKKCRFCKSLGAELAINYKKKDFVTVIKAHTNGYGVDLVLDMVGGDYLLRNIDVLAKGGRHVSIASQRGRIAEINITKVMLRGLILTGSVLRAQDVKVKATLAKALFKNIWPLLGQKKIAPVIDKVFALKDVQKAHDYLQSGKHIGKVVLQII